MMMRKLASVATMCIVAILLLSTGSLVDAAGAARYLLVVPNEAPGMRGVSRPVLCFSFEGTGPLQQLSSIPAELVGLAPYAAFNNEGELFLTNRYDGINGSISRFKFDENLNYIPNGTITSTYLGDVHGLAFSHSGELFAVNGGSSGIISRFVFTADGTAISNGIITPDQSHPSSNSQGLAFSQNGELFIAHAFNYLGVQRYLIDPSTGAATFNGQFNIPDAYWNHGLAFNSDGELFVADIYTSQVCRYNFQNGNPVPNGFIPIDNPVRGNPVGVAFSPEGELFVTCHQGGGIYRFLFDGSGNAISNGHTSTPPLGGPAISPVSALQPNHGPIADAGPDQILECFCQSGRTQVTLDGAGSSDPDGNPLTYAWTGPFEGSPVSGPNPTVKLLPGCLGSYEITLVVNDGRVDSAPDTVLVTVQDKMPPTITCPASIVVEATSANGTPANDPAIAAFLTGASATDNCDPSPVVSHDETPDPFPIGVTSVTFTATDRSTNASSGQATVTIQDTTPPEIVIVAPEVYGVYAAGSLTLNFTATDAVGVLELSALLQDAAGYSQTVSPGFTPGAGVYTLAVTAADAADNRAQADVLFVVYDPSAGFVTGGGWIQSPAGAYAPDPSLAGKATFGFVSKYHKGAEVPDGQTEFVFQTGNLNFHSTSYDWLVVTGSNYARFKGTGAINGSGPYQFMLWAGDGPDTFRIRIWTEGADGAETDIYDNGFDQGLGGGSIVIHDN